MTRDLNGKVAVVLGASAEAGSGWAVAEALAAAGAKVIVAARTARTLETLAAKIGGLAVVCDAAQPAQIEALAEAALRYGGRVDIAVNAAGLPMLGLIADTPAASLQAAVDVNYLGNVHFVRHLAAAMTQGGSIVLVTSLSTTHPLLPNFAYACAKAATDCLVRYAAVEYGSRGIRVNSIRPGGIVSDLTRDLFASAPVRAVFEKEVPLGRLAVPADIADAVLWLAGNAFVTGTDLPICGGNQLYRFPQMREMPGQEAAWENKGVTLFERESRQVKEN